MPESDDLKTHALNSTHDFYELLSIEPNAQPSEIRRAYRKTAPKYHPDKVGNDPEALEKFYLVQIAYDVLSDTTVRELYDNARKAKLAKLERDALFEGRRRAMKEDLERRETGASKRRKVEVDEEEAFARELRRLAEDGKRRRKEREEVLRREAEDLENVASEREGAEKEMNGSSKKKAEVPDIDRSLTLRYPVTDKTQHLTQESLKELFCPFGAIDDLILREKNLKPPGEKHRNPYIVAVLVFHSIVGAHAAMTDFPARARSEPETYGIFENLDWAAGKEPDFVPKMQKPPAASSSVQQDSSDPGTSTPRFDPDEVKPPMTGTPTALNGDAKEGGGKKAPTFSSFKPSMASSGNSSGPSLDEMTMMRLKNAERRRMEEKIRKEEAAAAAASEDGS